MLKTRYKLNVLIIFSMIFQPANAQRQDSLFARIKPLTQEIDPLKVEKAMDLLAKEFGLDPIDDAESLDVMYGTVGLAYINKGDTSNFDIQIKKISNKFNQTSYMNMAVDQLLRERWNIDYIERLSKRTIDLYNSYRFDSTARPDYFPKEDWKRFMKMAEVPYYHSHAHALYANNKERVALQYFEMAIEDTGEPVTDIETIDFYTDLLLSNCKNDRAYRLLLNTAKSGRSTSVMNEKLKELHKRKTGSDLSITQMLDSIQQNLSLSYIAEARSTMIANERAPSFELEDLHGKKVSLADFKNRVVVLDFWATWCAPCIASMPALDSVRKKHPEVVFLFISTGESGKDWRKKVALSAKTNIPSGIVLYDNSDIPSENRKASDGYKINLIPAKVVIDKQGFVRFRGSGFESDVELIRELEAMIVVANEQ